jgi:hypothetical protein
MYDLYTSPDDLSLEEEDPLLRNQPPAPTQPPPAPAQPPPEMEVLDELPKGSVPVPPLPKQPEEMEVLDKLPEGAKPIEPPSEPNAAEEFGRRVERGIAQGTYEGIAGLQHAGAAFLKPQRNVYLQDRTAEDAKGDIPKLEKELGEINIRANKVIGTEDRDYVGHGVLPQMALDFPDLTQDAQRSVQIQKQLIDAREVASGKAPSEPLGGVASRQLEEFSKYNVGRTGDVEKLYEGYILPGNNEKFWARTADMLGKAFPVVGAGIIPGVGQVTGMAMIYGQIYEGARNEALQKGKSEDEADQYAANQANVQAPLMHFGNLAFARLVRAELPALIKDADPEKLAEWLAREGKQFVKTSGSMTAAMPMQTLADQAIAEDAGIRDKTSWEEKEKLMGTSTLDAAVQSMVFGGAHLGLSAAARARAGQATARPEVAPPPAETAVPPVGDERFAPPTAGTVEAAPLPVVDWKTDQYLRRGAPPSPEPASVSPEIRLQGIDSELATATDPARRQTLEAEKVVINQQIQTRSDAQKAQATAENLRASNAPQTAAAVEAATAGHVSSEHAKLQAAIESVTPPEVLAPGQAPAVAPAPAAAEAPRPAAAPAVEAPAVAPPEAAPAAEAKIPYVPSEPQRPMPTGTEARFKDAVKLIQQGNIQQARVVMADILQNHMFYEGQTKLPHMPGSVKDWVEGQRPLNQAHNEEIRRRVNEMEMYTHPNAEYEGQASTGTHQATVIRPSEQINRHLEGVTVDVPMIDETGKPSVYRQNAADALRDLKRDRTGLELLINCL